MAEPKEQSLEFSDDMSVSLVRRLLAEALSRVGLGHIAAERYHDFVVLTLTRKEAWELMTELNKREPV